jgi:hypothetical protein
MKKSRRKLYLRLAAALFVLWVAFAASAFAVMRQPIDTLCRVMDRTPKFARALIPFKSMWTIARAGDLRPGDAAPEFDLPRQDGEGTVRLSDFRGRKPVVLVFGSYT